MISQAEKAVKEAEDKGLAANQALLERQEALNKLKEEAAQKKKEVKEEMARVRAESRAASAPASASRRLKAALAAGVHPRAAKKKEKDRQRAASHRAATMASRTADWKRHEMATHGMDDPDKWDQDDKGDEPEHPKSATWSQSATVEDISDLTDAGSMRRRSLQGDQTVQPGSMTSIPNLKRSQWPQGKTI